MWTGDGVEVKPKWKMGGWKDISRKRGSPPKTEAPPKAKGSPKKDVTPQKEKEPPKTVRPPPKREGWPQWD